MTSRCSCTFTLAALLVLFAARSTHAVEITIQDSVVSLATNATKNYTFTDPTNGLEVVVTVTMTPYSSITNDPVFSLLDFDGEIPTRLGVDSGTGGGDGNWVDNFEGVDFSAMLVSTSSGIITNSIRFAITGLGIRPEGSPFFWTSASTTNTIQHELEGLATLDTSPAILAGSAYSATLRIGPGDKRFQASNQGSLSGQSFVVSASFIEGTGEPVILLNPTNVTVCEGQSVSFDAEAFGDPNPFVQWQLLTNGGVEFAEIPGETNDTLMFTSSSTASGNQYRAVFSNTLGTATSSVAMLTVAGAISSTITPSTSIVAPLSMTNTASGPPGQSGYYWEIENGDIIGSATGQTVTFKAGLEDDLTLNLSVSNDFGCISSSFTNIPIVFSPVAVGEGVYVSDTFGFITKHGTNGTLSLYAGNNFDYPSGLAFDRAGNLYVANYDAGTISKVTSNGVETLFAVGLATPYPVAIDGDGNIYVGSYDDNEILKFDADGVSNSFADSNLNNPSGLAFDREGFLYVANNGNGTIWKFDTNGVGTLFAEDMGEPYGLAFDSTGNLFVANPSVSEIAKIMPDGSKTNFVLGLDSPIGLAFDRAGYLYATTVNKVLKISPDGNSEVFTTNIYDFVEFVAVWPLPNQLIPANPAVFSDPVITGNQVEFAITGSEGAEYVTQANTNLVESDWISLSTNIAPFVLIDTNTANFSDRYFRAIGAP